MTKRNSDSCYLCESKDFIKRPGTVRDRRELGILECKECGLVFLESFGHINEGFCESSNMHDDDFNPETWIKETICSDEDDERRFNQFKHFITNKSVLDFGCGAGGFSLRARDVAKIVEGVEVEKRMQAYFIKNGLKVYTEIDEISQSFDVITMFHVLEHIPEPVALLKRLARKLNDDGQIIIEVPNANDALLKLYKCEPFSHFAYWSHHLFLFTETTLSMMIDKAGLMVNYIK